MLHLTNMLKTTKVTWYTYFHVLDDQKLKDLIIASDWEVGTLSLWEGKVPLSLWEYNWDYSSGQPDSIKNLNYLLLMYFTFPLPLFEIIPGSFENTWHLHCLALSPFSRDGEAEVGRGRLFLFSTHLPGTSCIPGAVLGTRVHGESCQSYKTSFSSN